VERVVLGIGSNLGDRLAHLHKAIAEIEQLPSVTLTSTSSVYETKPWGNVDQPDFLNAVLVVSVEDEVTPERLSESLRDIEAAHGGNRRVPWGPRTLDIDIVDYGSQVSKSPSLTLPHPHTQERAFVLIPWLEVEPDASLPGWGSIRALASSIEASDVRRRTDLNLARMKNSQTQSRR
jgi:2-amino-4-hydroxy-6-hydroxymethyldihydropteridine diphosphokinase